jgi:hypothetical protein
MLYKMQDSEDIQFFIADVSLVLLLPLLQFWINGIYDQDSKYITGFRLSKT